MTYKRSFYFISRYLHIVCLDLMYLYVHAQWMNEHDFCCLGKSVSLVIQSQPY